jgi:hypothetical protein
LGGAVRLGASDLERELTALYTGVREKYHNGKNKKNRILFDKNFPNRYTKTTKHA